MDSGVFEEPKLGGDSLESSSAVQPPKPALRTKSAAKKAMSEEEIFAGIGQLLIHAYQLCCLFVCSLRFICIPIPLSVCLSFGTTAHGVKSPNLFIRASKLRALLTLSRLL